MEVRQLFLGRLVARPSAGLPRARRLFDLARAAAHSGQASAGLVAMDVLPVSALLKF
jgi:hypothetical protein